MAWSIEADNLTRAYGDTVIVENLNLRVKPGEFFGFLGANGAGKSTTIRLLCGHLSPSAGRVRIVGFDPVTQPVSVKENLGVLLEDPILYDPLTGVEFLEMAGRLYGLARTEALSRADDLLCLFQLNQAAHRPIAGYSMGMRKKTALAAALIHRPRVLFLDEPFNGMDTLSVRVVSEVLQKLTQGGTTVFFSSHLLETVETLCDRIAILHQGQITAQGTLAELRGQTALKMASLEEIYLHLTADGKEGVVLPAWL